MSFGGGLNGTGVPLVLKKAMIGQNIMSQPRRIRSQDSPRLHHDGPKSGKSSHLSTQKEAKTKRTIKPKKINAAIGVVSILRLLPPVAIR